MCAHGAHLCTRCVTSSSRILFAFASTATSNTKCVNTFKHENDSILISTLLESSSTRIRVFCCECKRSGNPYAAAVTAVGARMKYFSNSDVRFDVIWMHFACKSAITEDTISRELANRFDKCVRIKNAPIRNECNLINCTLCHRAPYIRASNEDFFVSLSKYRAMLLSLSPNYFLCFRLIEDIN